MTWEKIYSYFKIKLDDDEFSGGEDDALDVANIVYGIILNERDWHFLEKSASLSAGTESLAGITDFDRLLTVWAEMTDKPEDRIELTRANFKQRFNTDYDYWHNLAENKISLIGESNEYAEKDKIIDYIYKPDDITAINPPILPDFACPLISLHMVKIFKQADENFDFYSIHGQEYNELMDQLISYNESLEQY